MDLRDYNEKKSNNPTFVDKDDFNPHEYQLDDEDDDDDDLDDYEV
jgi:hypothetical protein